MINEKIFKDLFKEITLKRYRQAIDFTKIEQKLAHLRNGDALNYDDLEAIADKTCWPFHKYWRWPSKEQLGDSLAATKGLFVNLPEDEENTICELDVIFKHLSLVSCILRFAVPEHYGIYSRPNLKTLSVERGGTDYDEYANYLQVLRLWKSTFKAATVAETDEIIWAISFLPSDDSRVMMFRSSLPKTLQVQKIKNMQNHPLKVAREFLNNDDLQTASLWAARAFESWLQKKCAEYDIEDYLTSDAKINLLCDMDKEICHRREMIFRTKNMRNDIIHPKGPIAPFTIKSFCENIEKLAKL